MNLAWVDLETTGLVPDGGYILEIGILITNSKLEEVARYTTLVDNHASMKQLRSKCNDFVLRMHEDNGLWDAIKAGPLTPKHEIVEAVRKLLNDHDAVGGPMAGNSVGFDRGFLKAHLPDVESLWSYRNLDVSSFKEWFKITQDFEIEKPTSDHRAIGDIVASIEEMKKYKGRTV